MPQGFVTTARGEILNMDQLKTQANQPLIKKRERGTTVKKSVPPRKPINVRGYQPQAGEAQTPEVSDEILEAMESRKEKTPSRTIRASFPEDGEAKNLADVTGIRVNKPSAATKAKVKAALDNNQRPAEASTKALDEILGDLEETNPKVVKAAEEEAKTTVRRTRSNRE